MGGNGSTALVTGASSGIGRETAQRLAEKGYRVLVAARRVERLRDLAVGNPLIIPMPVDLSAPEDTGRFCREIKALDQPVSVLVNNAGYSIRGALEDTPAEGIRRIFEVNVLSLVRVTQACLPAMRARRSGTIVNLSSLVGKVAFPLGGVYAATKHAVEAISDALRLEVRPFGIRVVVVRPGPIATEFQETAMAMTGDVLARTHDDYRPVYDKVTEGMGRIFSELSIPGPDVIAEEIMAVLAGRTTSPSCAAGPLTDTLLPQRSRLDDEAFDEFWAGATGLAGLKAN